LGIINKNLQLPLCFIYYTKIAKIDLIRLPETGMGYQVIQAKADSNKSFQAFIVFNAELVVELRYFEQHFVFKENYIRKESLPFTTLKEISPLLIEIKEYDVVQEGDVYKPNLKGALEGEIEKANGRDHFIRLSHFKNDIRIDTENNRVLPGSFTTTMTDYLTMLVNRKMGLNPLVETDPAERYALPSFLPVQWVFNICPGTADTLQQGIVQPAYGRKGGGVECFFANGTSFNTFIPPPVAFNYE
jgi:hypothetical protein